MTTADHIAAIYGSGDTFIVNGVPIYSKCAAYTTNILRDKKKEAVRYIFGDGSVITFVGSAWDLGYADCWCWQGVGHTDECQA